ncbi:hypothetical protein HZB94_03240 [Candidatus Falkowbacteria bacterium]|nr:hypothetical protein [Candidatus Falkowbacteria bacterium]
MTIKEIMEEARARMEEDFKARFRKNKENRENVIGRMLSNELAMFKDGIMANLNRSRQICSFDFLVPENAKFVFRRGDAVIFVIEEKPSVRTVYFSREFVRHHRNNTGESRVIQRGFNLAFPYVIFVIVCFGCNRKGMCHNSYEFYTYFSNRPLKSLKDRLYCNCLTNSEADGLVCLPPGDFNNASSAGLARKLIDAYWKSVFSGHEVDNFLQIAGKHFGIGGDRRLRTLWEWERQSKREPGFVLKVEWSERDFTLGEKINRIANDKIENELPEDIYRIIEKIVKDECDFDFHELVQSRLPFLIDVNTPADFAARASRELKIALAAIGDELLTMVQGFGKKDARRFKQRIADYFKDLDSAPTTKGGGK